VILLSMLGTNDYKEVAYTWGDKKAFPSKFFQAALAGWFPQARVLICVTEEARKKHEQAVKQLLPSAQLIDIPSGKKEAEYWEIFNTLEQHIPTGVELVFDMTHGFRSLPTLALLAVSFLRAAKAVQLKYVLYGAYEARTEDAAPVFDLTPFMTMLDWASATNRFLETGDAGKFRPLVETRGARPLNTHLNSALKELNGLSEALSTNRAMRAGELSSKALAKIVRAKGEEWELSHAPLKLLLPRLEQGLGLIAQDDKASQQVQLIQSFGQVSWFLKHRQYEKALGLAREWMVSFAQLKRQGSWQPIQYKKRKEVEDWFISCIKGDVSIPDDWKAFIAVWKDLGNLRNDLMHFGFREAARSEASIPKEVSEKIDSLRKAVSSLGLELPEVS